MAVRMSIEGEFAGRGNGWTDFTRDVHDLSGIRAGRGMVGEGPRDRVATTGVLTFAVLNNYRNSAGLEGYYSPGHANVRSGWQVGMGVRAKLLIGPGWIQDEWITDEWIATSTAVVIWTGSLYAVDPDPGRHRIPRLVHVEARDYIEYLATHRISDCDVGQGLAEHDAFTAVIDNMDIAPRATEVIAGPDTYDYVFDLLRGESDFAIRELQRIAESSYATIYVKGDGTLVYEPRSHKRAAFGASLTPDFELDESDLRNARPIFATDNRSEVVNRVQGRMALREVDEGSEEVVYALREPFPIPANSTIEFSGLFTDPEDRSERIGAIDLVTPVDDVDYMFNTQEDGSGTDVTDSVNVSVTFCGDLVRWTLQNTTGANAWPVEDGVSGPGSAGDVLLQVRGRAVDSKEPILFERVDQASIDAVGETAITIDFAYQSEVAVMEGLVEWLRDLLPSGEKRLDAVPILLPPDDRSRAEALAVAEISDLFSVEETMTAFDGTERFWIDGIDYEARGADRTVWMTWKPTYAYAGPFITFPTEIHLTTGGNLSNASSYQTASVAPTADNLVLIAVASKVDLGVAPNAPSLTGNGLTYVQVDTEVYDNSGLDRRRITLFRAMGSAPTAGKVTIDFGGQEQDRCSWTMVEFEGVDTGGTHGSAAIVQSESDSDTDVGSLTVTLPSAFSDGDNRPAAFFACKVQEAMEPEASWTLLGRRVANTSIMSAWLDDATDTSATATLAGAEGPVGGIIVEIAADSGGGPIQ